MLVNQFNHDGALPCLASAVLLTHVVLYTAAISLSLVFFVVCYSCITVITWRTIATQLCTAVICDVMDS